MRPSASLEPLLLLTAATLRPRCSSPPRLIADNNILSEFSDALPFLPDELLADDAQYNGLGLSLSGRSACAAAASRWRASLPSRLQNFAVEDMTVLPPDGRRIVTCRYRISFDAPVPPAVLPGQRRRLDAAQLTIVDGRTRVSALVSASLQLDGDGKCKRFREALVADPFAVTTSIAHFELLNARAIALEPLASKNPIMREPLAYWSALRGMMRLELEEARKRASTDSLGFVDGDFEGVSDEVFEAEFRVYMVRIFALGFLPAGAAFAVGKLVKAAVESVT